MKLSSVFDNGENVPKKYTCDGNDINPALKISDVPAAAKSLVLIVDDPDAPGGTFVHWIAYNIDPKTKEIPEGVSLGTGGMNDFGTTKYGGPCPPPGSPHTYRFKLYAVDFDSWPLFEIPPDKAAIESFMEGHIIAQAELDGKYQR
ncbi:MAG: YbhB/YbcL family Raf kinase inhibitor-like protein [Candidatus Micrarchaeota archaeon]|nr:YbhB/YbcL family Raf kinase inhibitor-like protein [Candidatus Micrarchaeota archaeon]